MVSKNENLLNDESISEYVVDEEFLYFELKFIICLMFIVWVIGVIGMFILIWWLNECDWDVV